MALGIEYPVRTLLIQSYQCSLTCFFRGYANWTESGWNVRLHGAAYKDPPLTNEQIDSAAKPFVPGLDYDTMNDTMKAQARNMTSGILTVPVEDVYLNFDFIYNRQSVCDCSSNPAVGGSNLIISVWA